MDQVKQSANEGDAESQCALGVWSELGEMGLPRNDMEAAKWYRKAAEAGNFDAHLSLGLCYQFGTGVTSDRVEAAKWYRKAAIAGEPRAQHSLASFYKGVSKDEVEAVKWYRSAAEAGLDVAQDALGIAYWSGGGIAKDYVEAVKWFRRAAEAGLRSGQFNLGLCYDNGQGVHEDKAEAVNWYRKAAGQNHSRSQDSLAWILATSTQANLRDGREAVDFATRACEASHLINPDHISTLAAAHAEAGNFQAAVTNAQLAIEIWRRMAGNVSATNTADRDKFEKLAEETGQRLKLYQNHQAYRQGMDLDKAIADAAETRKRNLLAKAQNQMEVSEPQATLQTLEELRTLDSEYSGLLLLEKEARQKIKLQEEARKLKAEADALALQQQQAEEQARLQREKDLVASAWENSLGMKFLPVPGVKVSFSIWETRVRDYRTYAKAAKPKGTTWLATVNDEDKPVVNVNWEEAQAFCRWLTKNEQKAGKIMKKQSYRLPTDLEWSAAVGLPREAGQTPAERSGGVMDVYPWGTKWPRPREAGNYDIYDGVDDGYSGLAPVGKFRPTTHGLYDLGGNVWEWCEDWFNQKEKGRVVRDMGFRYHGGGVTLLSSYRRNLDPIVRDVDIGFRIVLTSDSTP